MTLNGLRPCAMNQTSCCCQGYSPVLAPISRQLGLAGASQVVILESHVAAGWHDVQHRALAATKAGRAKDDSVDMF
jgi:hypothetical protein